MCSEWVLSAFAQEKKTARYYIRGLNGNLGVKGRAHGSSFYTQNSLRDPEVANAVIKAFKVRVRDIIK